MYSKKENCSGCGLCAVICSKNAIFMDKDQEGFYYPKINKNLCISCGRCEKICIQKNPVTIKEVEKNYYVAEHRKDEIREVSSSGGIFSALADKIIEDDGIVISPYYDKQLNLKHHIIKNKNLLALCRGSKYTQSCSWETFENIQKYLDKGKKVLFTGTPCQVQAIRKFVIRNTENLYTQDIICHGCASPKIFQKYISYLEKEKESKVIGIQYRDKTYGWHDFSLKVIFENGEELIESHNTNYFFQMHLKNIALRPSCYDCLYRKVKRVADITLADYWGSEKDDDKGTSLVIINTDKGRKLYNSIQKFIRSNEISREIALRKNTAYSEALQVPEKRKKFFKSSSGDFKYLYTKFVKRTLWDKIKSKIK